MSDVIPEYIIDGGLVKRALYSGLDFMKAKSGVEHVARSGMFLFYIRRDADGLIIGAADVDGKGVDYEAKLPVQVSKGGIRRFFPMEGSAMILTGGGILFRAGMNDGLLDSKEGVIDAVNAGGSLVIIEKSGNEFYLNNNGAKTPLMVSGNLAITGSPAGRLISVTNGKDVEIFDLGSMKSLYQYSVDGTYALPVKYNLEISSCDEPREYDRGGRLDVIFYKVFIDGAERGRTETGPGGLCRIFRDMAEPDAYHLVRLERWSLDDKKGKYVRENNLNQPDIFRLHIPGNRIVRLDLTYDGRGYHISRSAQRN